MPGIGQTTDKPSPDWEMEKPARLMREYQSINLWFEVRAVVNPDRRFKLALTRQTLQAQARQILFHTPLKLTAFIRKFIIKWNKCLRIKSNITGPENPALPKVPKVPDYQLYCI